MRLFRHTLTQRLVAQASDEVIGHAPLPSECSLNNVWCECHVVATASQSVNNVALYGVDGRILQDTDPGDAQNLDTEWDQLVTKDADVASGAFTMDPGTSQSAPMFEPGEPSMEELLGMGFTDPKTEFYKRRKMLSFMSIPRGFEVGTPDHFIPGDVFKFHARRKMFVDVMSNAVLVFSNPGLDDMTTGVATTFSSETKWMQMKYFEVVLEQAWMQLMGLVEAGAETPWEEAALLVEEVLEPTVVEETASTFGTQNYNVFAKLTWDITVPGTKIINQISVA